MNLSVRSKLWISLPENVLFSKIRSELSSRVTVSSPSYVIVLALLLKSAVWAAVWLDTRRNGGLTYSSPLNSWWTEPETNVVNYVGCDDEELCTSRSDNELLIFMFPALHVCISIELAGDIRIINMALGESVSKKPSTTGH